MSDLFPDAGSSAVDDLMVDFTDIPTLEPVPNGTYEVEIIEAKPGTSKSGYAKLNLRLKIIGGNFDGQSIFETMSFHPKALWRVKNTLMALGWAKDAKINVAGLPEELVGAVTKIDVVKEAGQGTDPETGEAYPDRNRITKWHPKAKGSSKLSL